MGSVDQDAVVFRYQLNAATTARPRFEPVEILSRVPVIADYAGNDTRLFQCAVGTGARGVVVEAFGGGRTSPLLSKLVAETAAALPVVLSSRVQGGRVVASKQRAAAGIIAAGDLQPSKARILLMLALTVTNDARVIQTFFDTV